MEASRTQKYQLLAERIGRTPLKTYPGEVPRGNRIWLKCECENPFGSHYDRIYLALLHQFEELDSIRVGDAVYDTTSGSAGCSLAGVGRELGFDVHVGIPAGGEAARVRAIEELGGTIHYTPAESYIAGFTEFILAFKRSHPKVFFLNHSMGKRGRVNDVALDALATISREVEGELERIDFFIPAVGNGTSILGPARAFATTVDVIAFETFQAAVAYEKMYPGRYQQQYGIEPGSLPRHRLPGTSYQGIEFPHINQSISTGLLKDVVLVSDHASTMTTAAAINAPIKAARMKVGRLSWNR